MSSIDKINSLLLKQEGYTLNQDTALSAINTISNYYYKRLLQAIGGAFFLGVSITIGGFYYLGFKNPMERVVSYKQAPVNNVDLSPILEAINSIKSADNSKQELTLLSDIKDKVSKPIKAPAAAVPNMPNYDKQFLSLSSQIKDLENKLLKSKAAEKDAVSLLSVEKDTNKNLMLKLNDLQAKLDYCQWHDKAH